MTRRQAIQLLEGIYWADTEGRCGAELVDAGRALVREYGITQEEIAGSVPGAAAKRLVRGA